MSEMPAMARGANASASARHSGVAMNPPQSYERTMHPWYSTHPSHSTRSVQSQELCRLEASHFGIKGPSRHSTSSRSPNSRYGLHVAQAPMGIFWIKRENPELPLRKKQFLNARITDDVALESVHQQREHEATGGQRSQHEAGEEADHLLRRTASLPVGLDRMRSGCFGNSQYCDSPSKSSVR